VLNIPVRALYSKCHAYKVHTATNITQIHILSYAKYAPTDVI